METKDSAKFKIAQMSLKHSCSILYIDLTLSFSDTTTQYSEATVFDDLGKISSMFIVFIKQFTDEVKIQPFNIFCSNFLLLPIMGAHTKLADIITMCTLQPCTKISIKIK